MTYSQAFEACNDTELYQICRRAGIPVVPSTPREKMVAYLLGLEEPEPIQNPFDQWRLGIMQFLIDHWRVVEAQLACPAKSKDPRSCFQCVDTQVMTCIVQQNEHDQKMIQLRRK